MCGQFGLAEAFNWSKFTKRLGLNDIDAPGLRFKDAFAPTNTISIITQQDGYQVRDAIWWLLLEETKTGFKANAKYATFNSKSSRLTSSPVTKKAFKQTRCIIPATHFVEGDGPKGKRYYHLLKPDRGMIAFGGIYRAWTHSKTGEHCFSASIITLPGHPKLKGIHKNSLPLMLPINQPEIAHDWLSPLIQDTQRFESRLQPVLYESLWALPIERPGSPTPIGDTFSIEAD
ncbi:SOS response-associated peptidase family protein [Endozoicomonas sp. SM1973]|uniref:Abasic site processing protein n=1 Tax=Spartinivicinus marinus TaxID=2994442 RepID=A0A853I811_9GAMM|nr:SOS response-associated peptidase family protein [Spartinivicinus marinus]MCX4030209.1 SOS response-associated peptidase family protein [Spartinivicinus marinus]NYZ67852.1 SOS response-associated peptidase family protein [Spartinivicinus marinus]